MIKVLIDSDLIEEYFWNCDNSDLQINELWKIITQEPKKYENGILEIWSINDLLKCLSLNSIYASASANTCSNYNIGIRLSILPLAESDPPKAMIRNSVSVIINALNLLKNAGTNGLTLSTGQKVVNTSGTGFHRNNHIT